MKAIIYRQSKNVMQSGRAKVGTWVVEFDHEVIRKPESLMGWTSASSTTGQVRMSFLTLEKAKNFAENNGLAYFVKSAGERRVRPRSFADNYKFVPFEDAGS